MKTRKTFSPLLLKADALEYIFVEWLVRQGLFHKFSKNLRKYLPADESLCDCIRVRIRSLVANGRTDYAVLIRGAFVFARTPEGQDFWMDVADRWCDFLNSYMKF